jgi:signal transduction histidine kinase
MRQLLGVLRTDEDSPMLSPQPSLEDVATLVARVRDAGLPVELSIEEGLTGLPPVIALSAYRIIQEALTNTLKHAGSARAQVRVAREDGAVTIEVADNGCGPTTAEESGQGLVGMRERAVLLGGQLSAEPRGSGGFVVRATLPVTTATT